MTVAQAVAGFAVLAILLTIIPGLDTVLVLRGALSGGRGYAFATAFGISAGALVWGAAAAVGVAALLTASTLAYDSLRIAGALYMLWLGARLLWAAVRHTDAPSLTLDGAQASGALVSGWRSGFLTNLLNPKVGAFYVAVLPQFIPPGTSPLGMGVLLALVHDLLSLVWFTAIIFTAATMRRALSRRTPQRVVDGVTGTALVGFGLKLGLSSR
jgi:threonine/homoserine/homoserine lactone efflux protein